MTLFAKWRHGSNGSSWVPLLEAELRAVAEGAFDAESAKLVLPPAVVQVLQAHAQYLQELRGNFATLGMCTDELESIGHRLKSESSQTTAFIGVVGNQVADHDISVEAIGNSLTNSSSAMQQIAGSIGKSKMNLVEIGQHCQESVNSAKIAQEDVKASTQSLSQLLQASRSIDRILASIHKIAGQTNLLALNATIEAASAGDAGKGFAVVASEVKVLSRQTGQAVSEIEVIIRQLSQGTAETERAIQRIDAAVNDLQSRIMAIAGLVSAEETSVDGIAQGVQTVVVDSQIIGSGLEEIATNSHAINGTMQQILKNSASLAEGVGHSSDSVDMLKELLAMIQAMKVQYG